MTETEPSAPLPDRDAEIERLRWRLDDVLVTETMTVPRCAEGLARSLLAAEDREVDAVLRAERAEAENAVLRDRLARVEAECGGIERVRRALSAGTPTDSADETVGA